MQSFYTKQNASFSRLNGATKMDIVFKISLVNTDKPVWKVIQKYHIWYKLKEAICYQQIPLI